MRHTKCVPPSNLETDDQHQQRPPSRREFLGTASLWAGSTAVASRCGWGDLARGGAPASRLKVAAIFSHFTAGSHSELILENFLEPYVFNGEQVNAPFDIVSFYIDKFPRKVASDDTDQGVGMNDDDIGRDVARNYGIPLYPGIDEALCLGTGSLAVDAILSIGEYGYRPIAALSDREFPRRRFLQEFAAVMRRSNRVVPVFNDKNFSYRWDWGQEMYQTARKMDIPLMAGSSVPLAQRRPAVELPAGSPLQDVLALHGGSLEGTDYHAAEVLQSLSEMRQGGETGVTRVQHLVGDAVWKAADDGRWDPVLAAKAFEATLAGRPVPLRTLLTTSPRILLVDYADGVRGAILNIGGAGYGAAYRLKNSDQVHATSYFSGHWGSRGLFAALSYAVQQFFVTKIPPYPVERTLLAGGIVDAAMHSHDQDGAPVDTPYLNIAYRSSDWNSVREMGRTWEVVSPDAPPRRMKGTGRSQ